LPDTVWLPMEGFQFLPDRRFSFLLFPVSRPELFDSVVTDHSGAIEEIQVKRANPASEWVWGAFKLTGQHLADLHQLWLDRGRSDEYLGTLVNAYLAMGGNAIGVKRGDVYVDVGTLNGYREALRVLSCQAEQHELAS
jgi:glucose-1-phosphate thymidylyltransferase